MFPRLVNLFLLLSVLYTAQASNFRIIHRQDQSTDTSESSVDPGTSSTDQISQDQSTPTPTDTGVSATPTDDSNVSATITASASSGGTNGLSSGTGVLAGAGSNGGAVPVSCYGCESTYSLINTCSSEGSSESCSPICTGWSAAITCLNCLLQNGQENLSQSAVQQVVWNLESSCSDLGFNVFSATISATPTTTGPFTTPSGSGTIAISTSKAPKVSHSGLTVYNDNTRTPVAASTIQIQYATSRAQLGAERLGKGALVLGAGVVGGLVLGL